MAGVTQDPEAWARLGSMIRERREAFGLSRRQLSEVAGVSEKSIQVAEEGRAPRARWPQSLQLIEAGLRWEQGSMRAILEGGEPEPAYDLFSLTEKGTVPADAGESAVAVTDQRLAREWGEEATLHARSMALAALPRPLRDSLTDALEFGRKAAMYGAAPGVLGGYEKALEELILDLIGRPLDGPVASHASHPGRLGLWSAAIRMKPVRRKKEEELRQMTDRLRRAAEAQGKEWPLRRTPVVGGLESADVINELKRLSAEVERLARKVDKESPLDREPGKPGGAGSADGPQRSSLSGGPDPADVALFDESPSPRYLNPYQQIGQSLAEARLSNGMTVEDVAEATRVREEIVRSIEIGDFRLCGGDVYARGIIRTIARAVGADARQFLAEYDAARRAEKEADKD